ncbi:MAG TPA: 23S rRNA (guanosine(2251)-2'-O)-methyltransferase RlmB [Acidobacteriota bacterium]|nr:23S rRNA (guanosine(2251)-2'-O)-methyltransferase RlmB [Acidobacteriota bacterium]
MANNDAIIFGVNPVLEKLKAAAKDVFELLIADGAERTSLRQIALEAKRHGVNLVPVNRGMLDRLTGGQRHQGVVARIAAYDYLPFGELLQQAAKSSGSSWILVLDGLTDPRNFGALLRTAEAVGVNHVIIPKDRSVEVTPVVVKASAGAVHHLNITKVTNLRRAISELKQHNYWVVGLDSQSRESIYDKIYSDRLVVVLGSEGHGIRPINLRECDFVVSIPMMGKVGSLNVAVAGAVFLYEILRQRKSNGVDLIRT